MIASHTTYHCRIIMTDRSYYTEANREAWNEAASCHRAQNQPDLLAAVQQPDFNALNPELVVALETIGVAGKSAIQLCCNNAKDLLSVKRMGAGRCVGLDASAPFVEQGRELIEVAGLQDSMALIVGDLYGTGDDLNGQFDIVLVTVGVLSWLPDLPAFYDVVARLLRPGGHFVIEDMHPVLMMYEPGQDGAPSELLYSYFKDDPWVDTNGLDYFSHKDYDAKPAYSFQHKLDDILMGGINAGLQLRQFQEIGRDISNFCQDLQHREAVPPLGFVMVMEKA